MPKSKRNKQVELTKTKKRGLEWKKGLFEEVRSCVDSYTNVFIFSVNDMRNSKMKNVREQWRHSRFFIGKNKIMAMALGRFAEEEYKPNLHKLGKQIKGQRGLLFSNKSVEEVLSWFRSYSEGDYARSGNLATETVNLPAGPLPMFPHNLEPYLRELGLPTSLVKGVIHLIKDHEVCKVGDVLTPETAKILKMLGYEMAEFHITINCVWSQDGSFMQLSEPIDTDAKENVKKGKKTSFGGKTTETLKSPIEEMEVEFEEENESDDSENENTSEIHSTNPHKGVCNGVQEKDVSELEDKNITEVVENSSGVNNTESTDVDKDSTIILETKVEETSDFSENKSADGGEDVVLDILESSVDKPSSKNEIESTGVDDGMSSSILESNIDKPSIISETKVADIVETTRPSTSTPSTRKSRSTKRVGVKPKKVSLPKTPDADTSQDSPVFRQLRTRSVQFSAKKKK